MHVVQHGTLASNTNIQGMNNSKKLLLLEFDTCTNCSACKLASSIYVRMYSGITSIVFYVVLFYSMVHILLVVGRLFLFFIRERP